MAVATAAPALPARPGGLAGAEAPRPTASLGMALAVVADAMLLGGLLAAYVALRAESFRWPPRGVSHGTYLPMVITITMLMGVATAQWALYAVRRGDHRNCLIALGMTLGLALAVVNAEWYSFGRLGAPLSRNAYATLRDVLTGYHMVNVLVAAVMLALAFARTLGGGYDEPPADGLRAIVLFWHFAAAAWFAIFLTVVLFFK